MVAGIDDWLFKWADNKECEPEIECEGNVSCEKCKNKTCSYWQDYNENSQKEDVLITYEELSKITGLSPSVFRTYLDNFRFNKYIRYATIKKRRRKSFIFNEDFVKDMSEFLWLKRKIKEKNFLQKYYEKVRKND